MTPPDKSGWPRMVGGTLAILLLFSVGAYVAFQWVRPAAPEPVPVAPSAPETMAAPAPATEEQTALVVAVSGRVERARGGTWTQVKVGERLREEESLRTGEASRADLAIGSRSRLTVSDGTELTVRDLTRAVHRLKLTRGRIGAVYEADGERVLRIEDGQGTAVAEARAARFSVLSTGQTLAVATNTGVVNLVAAGKVVAVGEGQQAVAEQGKPPSAAAPIPAELLLKVARAGRTGKEPCAMITGTAPAGSEVTVGGVAVTVASNGRFVGRPPSGAETEGGTRVHSRDAAGRVSEEWVTCRAATDSRPGKIELEMKWGAGSADAR